VSSAEDIKADIDGAIDRIADFSEYDDSLNYGNITVGKSASSIPFDPGKAARYAFLDRKIKAADRELRAMKTERATLEPTVLEMLGAHGVGSIKVDGYLVGMRRRVWAHLEEGVSKEQACDALISAGLGHFVSRGYNSQTISSWMNDLDKSGEPIPEPLVGVLSPLEQISLGIRRAS
jgi:hypothetical protein